MRSLEHGQDRSENLLGVQLHGRGHAVEYGRGDEVTMIIGRSGQSLSARDQACSLFLTLLDGIEVALELGLADRRAHRDPGRCAVADLETPDRIEATVLGAFRLAHGTANVVPMRPVATAPVVAARRFSHSWMAVAATIVVGVAATLVSWQAMRSGPIVAPPSDRGLVAEKTPTERPPAKPPVAPPVDKRPDDGQYPGVAPGRGGGGGPVIPVSNTAGGRRISRPTQTLPESEAQELVTDFFSLVPASGFAPTEGGQLVRLEVPRSSLASLGVPIPVGNPDGSVTADLVMGYDGVAHAIRFVQPRMTDERRTR